MSTTLEAAAAATILQLAADAFVIELQPHSLSAQWHVTIRRPTMLGAETLIASGTARSLLGSLGGAIERAQNNRDFVAATLEIMPLTAELSLAWSDLAGMASEQGWLRVSGTRTDASIRIEVEGLAVATASAKPEEFATALEELERMIDVRERGRAGNDLPPVSGEFSTR